MALTVCETEVKVGSVIKIDGWRVSTCLIEGDDFSPFRVPTLSDGPVKSLAVRIEITGRTVQFTRGEGFKVRIRVVFVGDCEPDTYASGWLYV